MGTRSIIRIQEDGKTLVSIYQQYDGYPECVGLELAKFAAARTIVNGYHGDQKSDKFANGAGCFAAQFIAHIKTDIGGVYIYPADCSGEEYNYTIDISNGITAISCPEAGVSFASPESLVEVWDHD